MGEEQSQRWPAAAKPKVKIDESEGRPSNCAAAGGSSAEPRDYTTESTAAAAGPGPAASGSRGRGRQRMNNTLPASLFDELFAD